ncbi:MAG: hypothetical protein MUE81_08880 [Thermoflexibacter sp.]|nr:hypothetical protein [Thermoflexibacter sp.]
MPVLGKAVRFLVSNFIFYFTAPALIRKFAPHFGIKLMPVLGKAVRFLVSCFTSCLPLV